MVLNRENGLIAGAFSAVTGGTMWVLSMIQPWVMFNEAIWFPLITTYQRYAAPALGLPKIPLGAFAVILLLYAVAKFRQRKDETQEV
jgi:hypothetical protein